MYGGSDAEQSLDDTWEYNGMTWSLRAEDGPDQGGQEAMVYNAAAGNTVLYGDAYTWTWDGQIWTLRDALPPPPVPRHRHSMAYDADNGVVVLFGGVNAGQPLNDTWEWDDEKWSMRSSPQRPPSRFDAAMAYDTDRHVLVLLGGNRGGPALTDTWEFVCTPPCYPDLDNSGELDLFDFLAFTNLFNALDPKADCDSSGSLDLFDFLCFLNAFNEGCP